MPFIGMLFSKAGMIVMAVVAAVVVGALWLHSHDNAVRAKMQVDADKAIAAAQAVDVEHERAAVASVASDAQKRAVVYVPIKDATHAAAPSSTCLASPAIAAFANGMRGHTNGAGAKAKR